MNKELIKEFNFLTLMKSKATGVAYSTKSKDSKIGEEANQGLIDLLKVAKNVANQSRLSINAYNEAVSKVLDQEIKDVIIKEKENYKNTIQAQQKKNFVNCVKNLKAIGLTNEEAIMWASGIGIITGQELSGAPETQE